MRAILFLLSAVICASPASAISLKLNGPGSPHVTVYKPCETQVIVYDARPEMGISFSEQTPKIDEFAPLGVRIMRVILDTNTLEPTNRPGLYDSTYLAKWDQLVEDCRQCGICLCVALKCDASDTDRAARLASDMAARYPSVLYWEIDGNTTTPTQLKAIYPAIKTANPAAQMICVIQSDAALNALYAGAHARCFDVVCAKTNAKVFCDNAIALRKIMTANEDMSKPLWCIIEDGLNQEMLEPAFAANNSSLLYAKVLVEKTNPNESYKWLNETGVNKSILAKPRNIVNVLVPTTKPMIAVGYDFKEVEGGIEIQRVMLDSLVPTVIQLRYAPEPPPTKPGSKPIKIKPATDSRHAPDPFDI